MALPAENILVIGGGFSGMSAACALQKIGATVDLIELDPQWRAEGAGMTVSGPSLRAIAALGFFEKFKELGAVYSGVELRDASGGLLKKMPTPMVPQSTIEGSGGIMRPVFAKAMADMVVAAGVNARTGVTFTKITDLGSSVTVNFSDNTEKQYDLVIAADGVFSSVRKEYFPEAPSPQYTGQGAWRAVLPRFDVDTATMFLGKKGKVGFTPVSDTEMYLHYLEKREIKHRYEDSELLPRLQNLLQEFTAPVMLKIREILSTSSQILYRPLEGMLMPRPWYKGRVLLIGDCVHATTPHLASGAGMGHEDAVVFAEELALGGSLTDVMERYQNRRWERCRLIVSHSARLGEIEMAGGPPQEHAQIMGLSISALLAPV